MPEQESEDTGGRWGRTPYRPEDLQDEYGTTDSGRLKITCPGCGNDYYPVATCCVKKGSRTASPFCPNCGVDFRASENDVVKLQCIRTECKSSEAAGALREFINERPDIEITGETVNYREENNDQ